MTASFSSSWVAGGQPFAPVVGHSPIEAHCKTRAQAENALRAELEGTAFDFTQG